MAICWTRWCAISDALLVIGYGNDLRRDDGAGRLLAARLADRWRAAGHGVELLLVHQLTPELALDIAGSGATSALFVDARQDARLAIDLTPIQLERASPSVGHHLTAATLLAYAGALAERLPVAWQLTVPGLDFAHGEAISPEVAALIDRSVEQAETIWQRLQPRLATAQHEAPACDSGQNPHVK